jgi:hypothetical protein
MSHPPALARLLLDNAIRRLDDAWFFYPDNEVAEVLAAALDASR